MKKYGILAALVMTFALAGCGGGEQAEVPAQEAMGNTMLNSDFLKLMNWTTPTEKHCIFM